MGLSPLNRGVVRPDTIFRCDGYNLPQIWRNFNIFRAGIFHFLLTYFDKQSRNPEKRQLLSKPVQYGLQTSTKAESAAPGQTGCGAHKDDKCKQNAGTLQKAPVTPAGDRATSPRTKKQSTGLFFAVCEPPSCSSPTVTKNLAQPQTANQRSVCSLEAKKRPVRLRDLAEWRGLVPKGAFLSWCR